MKGYQAGIQGFVDADSVVFGISADDVETNTRFAESLELDFVLLSDTDARVIDAYGVRMGEMKIANRVTFVVDRDGKIAYVASGGDAMDPAGAAGACSELSN